MECMEPECVQGVCTTQLNCTHPDLTASLLELWRKRWEKGWVGLEKESDGGELNPNTAVDTNMPDGRRWITTQGALQLTLR